MCGIVGKISKKSIHEQEIKLSIDGIIHRGPDGNGFWRSLDKTKYIGSTRLSIHDLSSSGKMPMHDDSNKVHIVMNGEVYNFKEIRVDLMSQGAVFFSDSDTEVVLKAYLTWGIEFLDRLNGMYAIAIVDERTQRLFLIRDRVGEKPLYCYISNELFAFTSELKVILKDTSIPNILNYKALSEYLQYGYISSKHAILQGVWQLQPGTYLEFDITTFNFQQNTYWELPDYDISKPIRTESEYVNELEKLLTESVEQQLLADVPVGIFLSGGVDSSIVTAIASKVSSKPVKTFHISMKDAPNIDEQQYADIIAHYFNTDHTVLSANELTFDKFIDIIESLDEPMADSSFIPTYLVSELAKQHVTVVLGGDGGDELFAGYGHYLHLNSISNNATNKWYTQLANHLPIGLRGRNYLLSQNINNYKHSFKGFYDDEHFCSAINSDIWQYINPFNKEIYTGDNLVESCTRHDFLNYFPDDILVKVDRAAMANSLETRAPFLDKNIVEFAFRSVPSKYKLNGSIKKYLLKALAKKILPTDFPIERKQGFSIPFSEWVSGKWKKNLLTYIENTNSDIINKKHLVKLIEKEGKYFQNSNRIYMLLLLIVWENKYLKVSLK